MHAPTRPQSRKASSPGGGAPAYATRALDNKRGANHDQQVGMDIVRRALQAPVRQIAENAGFDGAVVVGRCSTRRMSTFGFDAQSNPSTSTCSRPVSSTQPRSCAPRCRVRLGRGPADHHRGDGGRGPQDLAPPMPPGGGMGGMGGMGF